MKTFLCLVVTVSLTIPLLAQAAPEHKAKTKAATVTAEDLKALRDALAAQSGALAAQQQQIQELKQDLERKDQVWQQAQQQLQQTQARQRMRRIRLRPWRLSPTARKRQLPSSR